MRRCKCRICGKQLTTDIAYCIRDKVNQYYCSEYEYTEYNRKKAEETEIRQRLFEMFEYVIGYRTTNTAIFKYINQWKNIQFAADAIDYHKEEITDIISKKTFDKEYPMLSYIAAIVNNHLQDWIKEYKSKIEEEKNKNKCSDADLYMPVHRKSGHRMCLDDFE